jgi:hypothetical protein
MELPLLHNPKGTDLPASHTPKTSDKEPTLEIVGAAAPPETVTINVALPGELHRRLRVKAIMLDLALKDAVAAAVDQWTS